MGHLREREKRVWELVVEAPRDAVTGRRRQVSRIFRGPEGKAREALSRLEADVREGRAGGTAATVATVVNRWLDLVGDDLSPTTVRTYRNYARARIVPGIGAISLAKLRTSDLDTFYKALRRDAGLSPASVRQIHAIVRKALGQAVRWGWLGQNPAANATLPRARRPEVTPPEPAVVVALMERAAFTDPDFAALIRLAADIGARRGELCALRWPDVDLDERSVVIARALIPAGVGHGGGVLEKDTKHHGVRRVAMSAGTAALLEEVLDRAAKRAADAGVELVADAFVFSRAPDASTPLYPDSVTKQFAALCKAAGVTGLRFHDVRHFVATMLTASGVDPRTVAGRLGHADAHTTLRVYSGFRAAADRQAADIIESLLASGDAEARRRGSLDD